MLVKCKTHNIMFDDEEGFTTCVQCAFEETPELKEDFNSLPPEHKRYTFTYNEELSMENLYE